MAEYVFKVAGLEHKQEIYDIFLSSFFPDMPLFSALGVKHPLTIDNWPALQTLRDGLTLIAISKEGEIMGYAMNVVPKEGDIIGVPDSLKHFFEFFEEDSKGLLSKLEKNTMELRVMCVSKKWRGHGIAKKLVEESENLAKKHGYRSIFGLATGAYMEQSFKRNGWNCVYRLHYQDYLKHDRNFIMPNEPHTSASLYEKVFEIKG